MKILMVLTSHDQLGDTGKKTGFWLEEFAAPYYLLKDAGAEVTLASPKGGQPPIDPKSDSPDAQTDDTRRFKADEAAQAQLAATLKLSEVKATDYDAVFYPGGHGPLWDLASDPDSIALIEAFDRADKPTGFVCHAPGVLRSVKAADGSLLVKGRSVAGFTNSEEDSVGLTDVVPFLVEDMLKEAGADYDRGEDGKPFTVVDGNLVTGQNPASSHMTAEKLLEVVRRKASVAA